MAMSKPRLAVAALAVAASSAFTAPATQAAVPTASIARKAPKVRCMQLDVAERKVRRAGFRVRLHGGGMFGIVVKSAWVVVHQRKAGNTVHLTAGRSC